MTYRKSFSSSQVRVVVGMGLEGLGWDVVLVWMEAPGGRGRSLGHVLRVLSLPLVSHVRHVAVDSVGRVGDRLSASVRKVDLVRARDDVVGRRRFLGAEHGARVRVRHPVLERVGLGRVYLWLGWQCSVLDNYY